MSDRQIFAAILLSLERLRAKAEGVALVDGNDAYLRAEVIAKALEPVRELLADEERHKDG